MTTQTVNIYTYRITQLGEYGKHEVLTVDTPMLIPFGVGAFQTTSVINGDTRITAVYNNVLSVELVSGAPPEAE